MTPPAEQATTVEVPALTRGSQARLRLQSGDLVTLVDVWALVLLFWGAKVVLDLELSSGVFALLAFAFIAAPSSERRRLTASALDDAASIFRRVAVAYVIASATALVGRESLGDLRTLALMAAPVGPAIVAGRALSYKVERSLRQRVRTKAVIVGAGVVARRVAATLAEHREYGLDVVGAFDDDPRFGYSELGVPISGATADLPGFLEERDVDVVIVTFSSGTSQSMVETIRRAQTAGAAVWIVPRFYELGAATFTKDHLWGLPVVRLNDPASRRFAWPLKRAFDVVTALVALALLGPLMLLAAAAVVAETGRPVFFRQRRIGRHGTAFEMLKFRSMTQVSQERQATEWCSSAEARVTKVGKFLRATGLDELPQLLNVLAGDMSLVGPRPERPHFVEEFSGRYPGYRARHRLPVGMTGWSQVNGLRGDTSIEERSDFDNYYIENWTLAEDLKIVLRTAKTVFKQ